MYEKERIQSKTGKQKWIKNPKETLEVENGSFCSIITAPTAQI